MKNLAAHCGVEQPQSIGWDFPFLSQEQIHVFHMHGYDAPWVLPPNFTLQDKNMEIITQRKQKYAAITIKEAMKSPFVIIPNAYKTLMAYMNVNGLEHKEEKDK